MLYKDSLELIGNTPLVYLKEFVHTFSLPSKVYGKLEKGNLAGSIKDRVAKEMLLKAFKENKISENTTIIEPTSGNTGIALAALCAKMHLKCQIVMPSSMSKERVQMMQAYGAEVILSEASLGMKGSIAKAIELKEANADAFIPSQFDNIACVEAHYKTTAKEIDQDLSNVDIIIAGVGTGGTISGIGKYFKEAKKNVKIIGVEPASSPLISKGIAGPHKIQGIGANFIPQNYKKEFVDEVITISNEDAYKYGKAICQCDGLFVGISSGAALAASIQVAKKYPDKNIVVILPDGGEKYLSVEGYVG